jgi:hypothetical protein
MTLVMQADGSSGADAYAEKDLGSVHNDLWITIELGLDAASLAQWNSNFSWPGSVFLGFNAGHAATAETMAFDATDWTTGSGTPTGVPPVSAGAYLLCELHHQNLIASDLYVDTILACSGADIGNHGVRYVRVGQMSNAVFGPSLSYIKSVAVGTTRGAHDLFYDNFASGTFAAWTTTSGDVSIVSSPFGGYTPVPPPETVYSRVYGIQITLSDDGVEQVAQLVTSLDGFA